MKKHLVTAIVYILLTFTITFPLILNLNTNLPGFFSSDESYAPVWSAWWLKFSLINKIPSNHVSYLAYPFGISNFFFAPIFYLINFMLATLTNHVFTYNFQVLSNLFLSALFTYLLAYTVIRNRTGAILSGLIFGCCPYILVRAWQHLGETYLWMMPMVLWLLFSLKEGLTKTKQLLLVISIVLSGIVLGTAYYTVIISVTFIIYFIAQSIAGRGSSGKSGIAPRGYIRKIIILLVIGYLITAVQYIGYIKSSIQNTHSEASALNPYRRPFEDLFAQSARPLSYFLPAVVHPVFGKFTEQFIGSSLYGVSLTEHTLYLGWIPLILAFIAFRRWKKGKKLRDSLQKAGTVEEEINLRDSPHKAGTVPIDDFNIGFFIVLAIVVWLFSQPPWWQWGPLKVYMPSFFMYKVLPMFRAYCRFGSVLMLAIAVLAGFGLKFVLEKQKNIIAKTSMLMLFCVLVLFEFWNYPPYKVIDVSKFPAVYDWLKEQSKDIVIAEYPLDAKDQSELYKLYQTKHERRIINASARGTQANNIALTITQLSSPRTAGVLKWLGVRYAIVHQDGYLSTELMELKEELAGIPYNPGLKLVKSFPAQECPHEGIMCIQKTGPIDVYEVIVAALEPKD